MSFHVALIKHQHQIIKQSRFVLKHIQEKEERDTGK